MYKTKSLFRTGKDPLNLKCSNGRIVNVRASADEKDEFFIVGRLESLSDVALDTMKCGDLLKTQAISPFVRILHVVGSCQQGFSGNRGEQGIVLFNPADPASGKDMLPVENSIVEQILRSIGLIGDQKTLDHNKPLNVFICEGVGVSRQVSRMLQSDGK